MKKLDIVYEDKYLIIVNKEENLLTVSTGEEKINTLFYKLSTFQKQKNKSNKIFIVNRLDRDTSGLVVFAKDVKTKNAFQNNWDNVIRKYYAVVEGKTEEEGTIKSFLRETKSFISYSSTSGDLAITKYKKLKGNNKYSLLDVNILTGRKNQIRVHMKDIGHLVIGDKKYSSKTNPIRRMGLHAYKLEFNHPVTNKEIIVETKIPKVFESLF